MVFHKLTMVWVYSKTYRVSRADKFMRFIFFFAFGPIITVGNTFVDTYFFLQHCMKIDIQKIKHKIRNHEVKKENMKLSRAYFHGTQEKILNFKDVSKKLREDMQILDQISDSLFPQLEMKSTEQAQPVDYELDYHALQDDAEHQLLSKKMSEKRNKMVE